MIVGILKRGLQCIVIYVGNGAPHPDIAVRPASDDRFVLQVRERSGSVLRERLVNAEGDFLPRSREGRSADVMRS